jgi:type IV pilus assembly protein PilO
LFRERQQIIIFIIAGMLFADFVLFGYLPSHRRMKSVKQAQATQRLVIEKATSESKQLPALEQRLLRLQKMVDKYEAKIPSERALGSFLQQLANLMTRHNLSEQVIAPSMEVKAGDLNCIPLDMKCKGGLKQIFEFYKQLQQLDRLVRIEQVELVNDADYKGQVSMQTKAVICYKTKPERG